MRPIFLVSWMFGAYDSTCLPMCTRMNVRFALGLLGLLGVRIFVLLALATSLLISTTASSFLTMKNVATGKPAIQSSDVGDGSGIAANSVDAAPVGGIYDYGMCSLTGLASTTWWMVDLLRQYDIKRVSIFNGETDEHELQNFTIDVFKTRPNDFTGFPHISGQVCAHQPEDGTYPTNQRKKIYDCTQPLKARYVRIIKYGNSPLRMCEVQVRAPSQTKGVFFKSRFTDVTANIFSYKTQSNIGSYPHCASLCVNQNRCNAFAWREAHRECWLYAVSPYSETVPFQTVPETGTVLTLNMDEL